MFAVEADIQAPADEVWRHLSDPDRMVAWMPGVSNMRACGDARLGCGGSLVCTAGRRRFVIRVLAWEPGARLVLGAEGNGFSATYSYAMSDLGDGIVRVTLDAVCSARGMARCALPLVRAIMRKADRWQLAYLKGEVERAMDAKRSR